jgi:sugar phosphate isomerase/epimerase
MRYAISNWIYGEEPIDVTLQRLQRFGYDGVELTGEPERYDPRQVRRQAEELGLTITSVAGMYPWPTDSRDLANPDPGVRQRAVQYLCRCVDFAAELGAPLVIVVPSAVSKVAPVGFADDPEAWPAAVQREWEHAVDSVRQAGAYGAQQGVLLAVEPINRYETFLVTTAADALRFVRDVGLESVKVHLDTFHMNIEEADPADAIRQMGSLLVNLHVADSNRQAVGEGHTDFRAILQALKDIGYRGALVLEPLPPLPNPYVAARLRAQAQVHDRYAEVSIRRLKDLEESLL